MERKYNKNLIPLARNLRKNMTKEEKQLWYGFLKGYPIQFYRQKVLGKYIADFYCAKLRLVIELDGSQHYETDGENRDAERTAFLENMGLRVLRIPNNAINQNFGGACEYIEEFINSIKREAP